MTDYLLLIVLGASSIQSLALVYVIIRQIGVMDEALARAQGPVAVGSTPPPPVPTPGKVSPPSAIPAVPSPAPIPSMPPKPLTEYGRMWDAMQIDAQHQTVIDRDAAKVFANKIQYQTVSTQCGVPWYVIGLIDQMEAGGGCKAHLHNGDPLNERTIHVPEGRPPAPAEPPFTWEQSALDALRYEKFDRNIDWTISGIASMLEKYNGLGYHNRGVPSPYLWSFSNQYHSGKFVKDHEYDPNAVSQQAGAMPILKALMALDPSIQP